MKIEKFWICLIAIGAVCCNFSCAKPKASPEEVVKKYVMLESYEEFEKLYELLSSREQSKYQSVSDYAEMQKGNRIRGRNFSGFKWSIKLGSIDSTEITKKKAEVKATLLWSKNGGEERRKTIYLLVSEDNKWKIDYIRDLKIIDMTLDFIIGSEKFDDFADSIELKKKMLREDCGFTDEEIDDMLKLRRGIYQKSKEYKKQLKQFD